MSIKKILAGGSAVALAATLGAGVVPASAAGDTPLSEVLTSDKNKFDGNGSDYDIVTEAVLAVLGAKPDSAVSVLTDGSTKLTAFVPNDDAFRQVAEALSGSKQKKEKKVFSTLVDELGVDTIEQVLLYHVVPGATITEKKALKSDGAKLTTAQGSKIKVKVKGKSHSPKIVLKDRNPDFKDPKVILDQTDINKGNKQIAHGIDFVLLLNL